MFVFPSQFSVYLFMSQIFFHSFPEHSVSMILQIRIIIFSQKSIQFFLSRCLILLHITVTNVSIHIMYSNVIVYSFCICRYENIVPIMEAWKDIQNVGTWCNCIGVCQYCGSFLATNISWYAYSKEQMKYTLGFQA